MTRARRYNNVHIKDTDWDNIRDDYISQSDTSPQTLSSSLIIKRYRLHNLC